MFSRAKNPSEIPISVCLEEPLTSDSCSKIITELMKYILYQKQQIPFSCDTLIQLQTRYKPTDRNFSSTKKLLDTIESISDQLTSQLHLSDCDVREVVIIIGATTISPKFCVRLELPSQILSSRNHSEYQHSYRKPLLTLMRSLIECPEFQQSMSIPLGLTNTFLLVQKSDSNSKSEFFLPKPQYSLPVLNATCFTIKFLRSETATMDCKCLSLIRVYHDNSVVCDEESSIENCRTDCSSAPYLWYQSKEIVKGFKYLR